MAMSDFLSRFSPAELIIGTVMLSVVFIGFAAIVAGCVVKVLKSNNQTRLKEEMISRGMSAEEIKTVLEAGTEK
jgi:hypothetical protein